MKGKKSHIFPKTIHPNIRQSLPVGYCYLQKVFLFFSTVVDKVKRNFSQTIRKSTVFFTTHLQSKNFKVIV